MYNTVAPCFFLWHMKSIVQQLFNFQESTKGFHLISCGLGDVKTISALNLDHKAKKKYSQIYEQTYNDLVISKPTRN